MSLIKNECIISDDKRRECVVEELGIKYKLNNYSDYKLKKIAIEKCVMKHLSGKKCDYLIEIDCKPRRVIFIELKGKESELTVALSQLHASISYLNAEYSGFQIDARIVGAKSEPDWQNGAEYKRLARLILPTKGSINRKNIVYEESI